MNKRSHSKNQMDLQKLGLLFQQSDYVAMEKHAQRLLKMMPTHAYVWKALAVACMQQGKNQQAEQALYQCTKLAPQDVENLNNLGVLLQNRHAWSAAEQVLRQACQLAPLSKDILFNLATTLMHQHKSCDALLLFQKALSLAPSDADVLCNMGCTLDNLGRTEEAIFHLKQAIALNPSHASSYATLGNITRKMSDISSAIAFSEKALRLDKNMLSAYSTLFFSLLHDHQRSAAAIFATHAQFGDRLEATREYACYQHTVAAHEKDKLRIGFVSGDMREHALSRFIKPILSGLCRDHFEVFAYSNHPVEDAVSDQIKCTVTQWRNIFELTDVACAKKIKEDNVDILIDLSGHTDYDRLAVFMYKPAPVQMSWMGYPGTTGLRTIDYYILDACLAPPGRMDDQFVEKLIRLPVSAPFLPYEACPDINPLPFKTKKHLTFASFARSEKINQFTANLWRNVLQAIPNSQLLIAGLNPDQRSGAHMQLEKAGVEMSRVHWKPRTDMQSYLALHHEIDILLDTYPYNGATTSLYGQWMGVPTLTLTGETVASRQGAAAMSHVGLDDFITDTPEAFVEKACYWATHEEELATLRANMRQSIANCTVRSPEAVVATVERALKQAWERWRSGQAATAFQID